MLGKTAPFKRNPATKRNYKIYVPIDVQKAKEFPIENLYMGQLKKTGKVKMGKCPFHSEDTPSFAIYPATNSWFCFAGCGGGDVIKFYQKLHDCSFKVAIEELSKK